jgi:hypothetical protein
VSGRALAFSDADIVKMASEDYVPVTADDWYQRRREDAEGRFFRKVADQGPRKGQGGSTRQGIYCLTADGQLLTYKNAGQDPDVMREVLKDGLARWRKLPASRRTPGAVKIEDPGTPDARYVRKPPKEGLILRVFTRTLDRTAAGKYTDADCERGDAAAQDHCWLTKEEWQSLIPAVDLRPGRTLPVPDAIAERWLQFHLTDNTRGEPPMWQREEIRSRKLTLTVADISDRQLMLTLEGVALLSTDADTEKASRGYDAKLTGQLAYDRVAKKFTRFDLVVLGDHWGRGTFTGGARPGRTPLGVAFELADGSQAADRVPPQGARELQGYLGSSYRQR